MIEYQKRGLPHAHILATLAQEYKLKTPERIDKFISAVIPDPDKEPILHDRVMKHMIHGPCGPWCIVDGKCSKKFPQKFSEETVIDDFGNVTYKRPDTKKNYHRTSTHVVMKYR